MTMSILNWQKPDTEEVLTILVTGGPAAEHLQAFVVARNEDNLPIVVAHFKDAEDAQDSFSSKVTFYSAENGMESIYEEAGKPVYAVDGKLCEVYQKRNDMCHLFIPADWGNEGDEMAYVSDGVESIATYLEILGRCQNWAHNRILMNHGDAPVPYEERLKREYFYKHTEL
ncbi:hypothetical protein [Vibrio phage vB_VmeM-Yong XC32]|nr:hypothetical protein [Vibrio phage vB_VmeM-Yong XC31]QAX96584.1 hypothetical protein [Vibrio phage vB_VmeM-Yong XC32]QAX96902.1 hypothetical protein [Vibrio phage vB_VmeM-Yong MS31]QAX97207.1 hypothetical protein [Vibrio phage vB_VmeM-Yong MS32]